MFRDWGFQGQVQVKACWLLGQVIGASISKPRFATHKP